jgi:hypothetical protein
LWRALRHVTLLKHGQSEHALHQAEALIAPFAGVVTVDMLTELSVLLPAPTTPDLWRFAAAYVPGQFPFDAYVPAVVDAKAG